MKKIKLLFAAIIVSLLLTHCDYVTPKKSTVINDTSVVYKRNVLVEDYSAHKCGYCPYAAYALDSPVIYTFGAKVIPINIQTGFLATPDNSGFYTTDFRTTVGTNWDNLFQMSNDGEPIGLINRVGSPVTSKQQTYTAWYGLISNILNNPASMNIKISNTYDSTTRIVNTTIMSKYLQQFDSTYILSVVLTEDSIIDNQEEYYPPTTTDIINIPNFVFNHMLRASLTTNNLTWGDTLSVGPQAINDSIPKTYSLTLDPKFKAIHCNIVAFIYNAATYEVVQAEMARVTH